jgi:LacI family transcriptional regulator
MRKHPPDGLLVCQPTHAVTALGRLLITGWHVPRDVKLISRDDDPFLEHIEPLPARYSVRPGVYAARLARIIDLWLDGQSPTCRAEQILPEFIVGETL